MNYVKKSILILLSLALCIGMAACSSKNKGGLGELTMPAGSTAQGGLSPLGETTAPAQQPTAPQPTAPQPTAPQPTAPQPTTPQPTTPQSAPFSTQQYSGPEFSMTIPAGWQVMSLPFDPGDGGGKHLFAVIYDPTNDHNRFWYATELAPFFASAQDRQAWLNAGVPSYFQYVPVLTSCDATDFVRNWSNIYKCWQGEGMFDSYFYDYQVTEVLNSNILVQGDGYIGSEVLGVATIPGDSNQYGLYFANKFFATQSPVAGLPGYLSSGPNFFLMATMDMCREYMDELIACLNTFEINAASGIGAVAGGEQRFNGDLGMNMDMSFE